MADGPYRLSRLNPSQRRSSTNGRDLHAIMPIGGSRGHRQPAHRAHVVTTHRVLIEPTHRKGGRQFYKVSLDGEAIVAQSWSPGFTACRTMKKRGLVGRVEFVWAGVPYPGLVIRDLHKGARLRVIEEDRRGPALKEWQPPKMLRHPGHRSLGDTRGQAMQS